MRTEVAEVVHDFNVFAVAIPNMIPKGGFNIVTRRKKNAFTGGHTGSNSVQILMCCIGGVNGGLGVVWSDVDQQ